MRIAFCPFIDLLSTDIPCILDVSVKWELGTPHLVIDNIYESGGKVSILFNNDPRYHGIGSLIADAAEHDEKLLDRAVEQADFDREAA